MEAGKDSDLQWFALRVKPRHEKRVAVILRNKGYEPFLPSYKCRRRRPDRYKYVEFPLFPGYLFCRFNVRRRLPILTTPGVVRIVGSGKIPVPVEDHEIGAIQRIVASQLAAEPWSYLEAGQSVEITEGPLRGVVGILLSVKSRARLIVSVMLLQRSVAVEIDCEWASPVVAVRPPFTTGARAPISRVA